MKKLLLLLSFIYVTQVNAQCPITVSGSATICVGGSTTFTANGATTYTWVPAASLDNPNIANPTASPTTTTIYTVTATTGTCTTSGTTTVIVNPIPSYILAGNVFTICNGGQQTFTVSGASSYTWTPATTLDNSNIANPTASPTTTTVYSVTGTDANACTNLTPATVTVNVVPAPSLSVVANSYTICEGNSQMFSASGASTYTWVPAATLSAVNIANPVALPLTTTIYTVYGTASGCAPSAPLTVTLTVNPTPTVSINSASSVCTSTCAAFSSTVSPSTAGDTYMWDFGNGAVAGAANPSYCYTVTGTSVVSLTVTDVNGCVGTATTNITVNPTPSTSIQVADASCNGMCNGSATVTASGGLSPYSFIWAPTGGTITGASPTSIMSNLCAGVYKCWVQDANACADTIVVPVNQPTTLAITYTLVQDVAPHTWDLFYTATGGSQPFNYTFNWGDGSSSNAAYPSHTYSVAGTYSICATVTDNFGCSSTICQNDAVFRLGNNSTYSSMVSVNVKSGIPGALAYQKLLADTITEFDAVAICMLVIQQPKHPQTLNNCVSVNFFGGAPTNSWYANGDSLYNGKIYKKITYNNSYNTTFQGLMREDTVAKKIYFIQYCNTNEELLYNFSLMQGDTITYNFPNSNSLMTSGVFTVDSVRIKHDYASNYFRHFYLRNHLANNPTLEMIEGVGNVSHPLFLYYSFQPDLYGAFPSCSAANFSEALSCKYNNGVKIYSDSCLAQEATTHGGGGYSACNYCWGAAGGINQYSNLENVSIYPNPAQNNFTVEVSTNEKQTLQLFDVNGKLVLAQTINEKTTIDASSLNAGVYSLNIISNTGVVTKKLVIVK